MEPEPSLLHTVTSPPWVAATCLTMARPRPGAAGGPGAGRVDAVEPLEDPFQVALGDADALVGDADLDDRVARRAWR